MNFFKNNALLKRIGNGFLFYKKRFYVFGAFSTVYLSALYKFRNHENEIVRMAMAGSISNMITEVSFHFADTVNTRSKLNTKNLSAYRMLSQIYTEEGMYGLSKGITASFYGSLV